MKVLTVKQYLRDKSLENIDERLTQAFVEYLLTKTDKAIRYEPNNFDSFYTTKLEVKFKLGQDFPLRDIYGRLLMICITNGASYVSFKRLEVTPEYTTGYRGILATIKIVK